MILISSYGMRSPIAQKAKEYIKEPENKKILVVPFAGFNNENTAAYEINEGLIPFGFKQDNIFVCSAEEPFAHDNERFDLIYVPGGNPFKLLKETQETEILPWLRSLILDKGVSYWGVSSGADLLCEELKYLTVVEDNDYNLESFEGLGLIKENIICHSDQREYGVLTAAKNYSPDKKLIMLRNDELYRIR